MKTRRAPRRRVEFGDWQTPAPLASAVVERLARDGVDPRLVVEPTCGHGSFLAAAARRWPAARLRGYDVNAHHVERARSDLGAAADIEHSDFFATAWETELRRAPGPVLVLGNPPWVTSADLGALESENLPTKRNVTGLTGLDAITGKANFDVSEWMLRRLLDALGGLDFTMAMLCKSLVARRLMEQTARLGWEVTGALHDIDAMHHFGAAVDAVLLTLKSRASACSTEGVRWPRYPSLTSPEASAVLGVVGDTTTSNIAAFEQTRALEGQCLPQWRSGLKHDCSAVMELRVRDGRCFRRSGEPVDIEPEFLFPLMKGSDVANARWPPSRAVVVPQRSLGEDTRHLERVAPKTWAYLSAHRAELDRRRSSIYVGQPPFAIFGIGQYTFAPWKVAIAGLYKRLAFMLVGPHEEKPVVFDDTTYFLPFPRREDAEAALEALRSPEAARFFDARVFWDDKRPINKRILQSLDLVTLQERLRRPASEPLPARAPSPTSA